MRGDHGHDRKRFRLGRASLLAALTTVFLASGYGFAVYALTRTGNAGASVGAVTSVPISGPSTQPITEPVTEPITTEPITTEARSSCRSRPGGCQPPADTAPDGVFLCYSKFETIPGIWPQDQAAELLMAGYWHPNAVPGNVPGGSNLGDYHLVCNATGTPTGKVVNENGEVFPDTYPTDDSIGYYPLVG